MLSEVAGVVARGGVYTRKRASSYNFMVQSNGPEMHRNLRLPLIASGS